MLGRSLLSEPQTANVAAAESASNVRIEGFG
jgi:hypothetical protein